MNVSEGFSRCHLCRFIGDDQEINRDAKDAGSCVRDSWGDLSIATPELRDVGMIEWLAAHFLTELRGKPIQAKPLVFDDGEESFVAVFGSCRHFRSSQRHRTRIGWEFSHIHEST